MARWILVIAGISGALAVGLGAYGAHGLEALLEGGVDAERKLGWWNTAVGYHLAHSVALAVCAALPARRGTSAAAGAFVLGALLFAGTLYAMTLGAPRWLGAITPLGGLSLIVGWLLLAAGGWPRGGDSRA